MKKIIRNIIGTIVGILLIWLLFPPLLNVFSFVLSIPVFGDIIRFGMEPAYIVLPYSVMISSFVAAFVTGWICSPTRHGKRAGLIALSIYMALQFGYTIFSLFKYNGYDFAFIVLAITVVLCVIGTFYAGMGNFNADI